MSTITETKCRIIDIIEYLFSFLGLAQRQKRNTLSSQKLGHFQNQLSIFLFNCLLDKRRWEREATKWRPHADEGGGQQQNEASKEEKFCRQFPKLFQLHDPTRMEVFGRAPLVLVRLHLLDLHPRRGSRLRPLFRHQQHNSGMPPWL